MIRDWVFDLDNTLYPAPTLYDEIGQRMNAYIARTLAVDEIRAQELRERYFHQYGATVCGLVAHHGVNARDFLAYVHDADHSVLSPDPELDALLARLPGRKLVFTNGGGGHAQRVLETLGLARHFAHVFDIEDAGLAPKPQKQAYERLIAAHAVAAGTAILVEDTLKNLEPAHAMGFRTALVGATHPDPHVAYVDHWAPDVSTFLRRWLDAQG
ncbi:MAG: pyrimidine 5'-nucleotidase [Hyphomonadaceae bacterium]|nr:pyrimidine 5'-nucleotidase [Hyphomonadaceae bacterium]MBX3510362.1 pyrimidine 5'-nucleotidase [Hyphomonadaceae bacterium]